MQIFVTRNNENFGPYSKDAALEYIKQGIFRPDDHAWTEGMQQCKPLGELLGIQEAKSAKATKAAQPPRKASLAQHLPKPAAMRQPYQKSLKKPYRKSWSPSSAIAMLLVLLAAGAYFKFGNGAQSMRNCLAAFEEAFTQPAPTPVPSPTPAPRIAAVAVVATPPPVISTPTPTPAPIATPAPPPPFDPSNLAANRSAWPRTVRLLQDFVFPVTFNGQRVGTVQVPAGTTVQLVNIVGETLAVAFNGNAATVPWKSTDLEEATARAAEAAARAIAARAVAEKNEATLERQTRKATKLALAANVDNTQKALLNELRQSKYELTPEVENAYLINAKARALNDLFEEEKYIPQDFLAWVDSDPIVRTTVYGARADAENELIMLRSLDMDLGSDAVRGKYTQLALAIAVASAQEASITNIAPHPPLKLVIPGDPRKPVNTKPKDRPLDVNDHIINFLEDHPPILGDTFGAHKVPLEMKTDDHGVGIMYEPFHARHSAEAKVERPLYAADVLESKSLQDEFNAYMAAHGQSVRIDCGDHAITPNSHDMIEGAQGSGIMDAYKLFRTAYEAKGRLPASRDPSPTASEKCAYIIRNDELFPPDTAKHRQTHYSLNSPWPTLTLLAESSEPLRERDEVFYRYVDTGEAIGYGEYIGSIAQQYDFQSARRLTPYPFTYGSMQMMMKDGGVCGTMANMAVRTHTALGTPSSTAGQPEHCALISFFFDTKTHSYTCQGEQYVTAGDEGTHPHANWVFGDTDAPRDMVWHQSVAWGVNAGFQSYLDSMVALDIYRSLSDEDKKAHGLAVLLSGWQLNRYNMALVEAAMNELDTKENQAAFKECFTKLFNEHGGGPGRPATGLFNTTVQNLFDKHTGAQTASN